MLILLVIIAALMFIPAGVTTTSSNGFCATLISAEGEPSNPDPYSHQRQNCGALSSPTDCSKGGTPAWLEKNRPFTCEWQAFT
jgi:hypothetical protein